MCFGIWISSNEENETIYAKIGGGDLSNDETKLCVVNGAYKDNFCPYSFQNDVAIIRIACEHTQTISLATTMPSLSDNIDCLIYGYGSTGFETNTESSILLRYAHVKPISYSKCEKIMGRAVAPIEGGGEFCAQGIAPNYADACGGV